MGRCRVWVHAVLLIACQATVAMTLRRAGKVCALNTSSLPASTKVQPAGRQQYATYNGYEKVAWTCSGPDLTLAARLLGCQGCLVLVEPLCHN